MSGAFLARLADGSTMDLSEPAWHAALATLGGYVVLAAVMTVLLFGLPLLAFWAL